MSDADSSYALMNSLKYVDVKVPPELLRACAYQIPFKEQIDRIIEMAYVYGYQHGQRDLLEKAKQVAAIDIDGPQQTIARDEK